MTNDEVEKQPNEDAACSNADNGPHISFTLQGTMGTSDHSHLHHHAFRHLPGQENNPLRFKDSRANEQASKLRDKLRDRQLGGAAQNSPASILVPYQGECRSRGQQVYSTLAPPDPSTLSPEDLSLQALSSLATLSVGGVTPESCVVTWDLLELEGVSYTALLTTGKKQEEFRDVESPYLICNLLPGMLYNICVIASLGAMRGSPSPHVTFETPACAPSQPAPPRPGGATKTSLHVKWSGARANGSPITGYILYMLQVSGEWSELARSTERQYKVTGLAPGTQYSFCLSAVNDIGESLRSEVGVCRTGVGTPNPPTCIYLGHASETELTICWSPPTDNGGATVIGYSVEQETEYGFQCIYNGEVKECSVTHLARSTQYKFRVYSRNVAGQSKPSNVVMFTTRAGLPPKPTKVRLEGNVRSDAALISWDSPVLEGDQQILRYNLKVSPLKESLLSGGFWGFLEFHTTEGTKLLVTGLQPGTAYRVLVTVVTAGGEGPASSPFIVRTRPVTASAPAPPALRSRPHPYSLNLQWAAPSYTGGSTITKYTLEMYTSDWVQVYSGSDVVCLVQNLNPGKSYKFRLRCHNVAGSSLYSNIVNFLTAPAPPDPPSPPSLISKGPYAASVTWEESASNGAPVTSYSVELCLIGDTFIEVYNDRTPECVVRDLAPGSTYYCIVKAGSTAGYSLPCQPVVYCSPPAPPHPPSGIHTVHSTDRTLGISWEEAVSPGAEVLQYNVSFNGDIYKTTECRFEAAGLKSGTTYKLRVQAVNAVGAGQFSAVTAVSTSTALPGPLPGPLQILTQGHNFVRVGWPTCRAVKSYCVQRGSTVKGDFLTVFEGNKSQAKIGRLRPKSSYTVRVCGVNEAGLGPWIETLVTTDSPPPPSVTKVNKSLVDTDLTLSWCVKEPLREDETYEVLRADSSDIFNPIYEGVSQEFHTALQYDTAYSFKVRVKRSAPAGTDGFHLPNSGVARTPPTYGPFSPTILIKLRQAKTKPEAKREAESSELESDSDYQIVMCILLALCLPAIIGVVYFVYFA